MKQVLGTVVNGIKINFEVDESDNFGKVHYRAVAVRAGTTLAVERGTSECGWKFYFIGAERDKKLAKTINEVGSRLSEKAVAAIKSRNAVVAAH